MMWAMRVLRYAWYEVFRLPPAPLTRTVQTASGTRTPEGSNECPRTAGESAHVMPKAHRAALPSRLAGVLRVVKQG